LLHLPPDLPAMKAHGVPELTRHLAGEISLDEASRLAVVATGQYAKRQFTWLRHQVQKDYVLEQQYNGSLTPAILNNIRHFLLPCSGGRNGCAPPRRGIPAGRAAHPRQKALMNRISAMSGDTEMLGAAMVLRALADQGVDTVFGYPGGAVLPIYDELFKQNRIRHILVRHEQAAVHAAEGYARSTGKVGVVLVTSGPGATNAVTGLTDALMDSIPIVCLTGQVPTHLIGNDAFQ